LLLTGINAGQRALGQAPFKIFNIFERELSSLTTASDVMQFADNITDSITNTYELAVVHGLTGSFQQTKACEAVFSKLRLTCEEGELIINSKKTQFIIFN